MHRSCEFLTLTHHPTLTGIDHVGCCLRVTPRFLAIDEHSPFPCTEHIPSTAWAPQTMHGAWRRLLSPQETRSAVCLLCFAGLLVCWFCWFGETKEKSASPVAGVVQRTPNHCSRRSSRETASRRLQLCPQTAVE